MNFDAKLFENDVLLNWKTAMEYNNRGFEIYRSNGDNEKDFVGFVNGAGTSSIIRNYEWMDYHTPKGTVLFYYLNQVDFDGQSEMFGPIMAETSSNAPLLGFFNSEGDYQLNLNENLMGNDLEVSFIDNFGKIIKTFKVEGTFKPNVILNTREFKKGIYVITIQTNNRFESIKSLK